MRRLLPLLAALAAVGCGASGGSPLPPLRPLPPALADFEIAQRGTDAVIRFAPVPPVANVEGAAVEIDRIELLLLTDRYPALTPEVLATALQAERRDRMELAREAAERAERTLARQRGDELEEPPVEEEEAAAEEEPEETLTPEEALLRRVPSDARMEWREQGIRPEVLLESARRLERAVDELWTELELPSAIVDLRNPPELPDPVRVIEAAERISRRLAYENDDVSVPEYLLEAAVVAAVPMADIEDYRTGEWIQLVHPLGTPADAPIRSRYLFAVRAVSARQQDGAIDELISLAPARVPAPPPGLSPTVLKEGVRLTWTAPAADVTGEMLEPAAVGYNVYRRRADQEVTTDEALNELPLRELTFLDEESGWEESWIYEVRALRIGRQDDEEDEDAPPLAFAESRRNVEGPLKESLGSLTEPLLVSDLFPPAPPTALQAVRAGRTVTVRWTESGDTDLAGYRVYRHPAPMPELPGYVPPPETPTTLDDFAAAVDEEEEATTEEEGATPPVTGEEGAEEQAGAAESTDDDEAQETETEATEPVQRPRRNLLVAAGWELLTAVSVTEPRYIDPASEPGTHWIYVVEAIDEAGNVSTPVPVELEAVSTEQERQERTPR